MRRIVTSGPVLCIIEVTSRRSSLSASRIGKNGGIRAGTRSPPVTISHYWSLSPSKPQENAGLRLKRAQNLTQVGFSQPTPAPSSDPLQPVSGWSRRLTGACTTARTNAGLRLCRAQMHKINHAVCKVGHPATRPRGNRPCKSLLHVTDMSKTKMLPTS